MNSNEITDCDPLLLVPAALLLASKIEESPINMKNIVKALPKDYVYKPHQILECESLLMSELDFYLTVYHAYKPLKRFTRDCHQLQHPEFLQTAWNIVNDSYYSDVCLQYPPYLIALAVIYMTSIIEKDNRNIKIDGDTNAMTSTASSETMSTHSSQTVELEQHVRNWFSNLNVDMRPIGHITNQLMDMYQSVSTLQEDVKPAMAKLHDWRTKLIAELEQSKSNYASPQPNYTSPQPLPQQQQQQQQQGYHHSHAPRY